MNRKLQIFVSSTYRDLLAERQAAVEAILRAGHIPAGMELFAAGDRSQLDTICRWIDESDVYMLILGSRYGSVDKNSGKSYTQLEYEYAIAAGKRFFAVVLTDVAIDQKVRVEGRAVIEAEHPKELADFRSVVMSKVCRLVDDPKDIKLAIHETILQFLREYSFDGWVSGKDVAANDEMARELARLIRENAALRAEVQSIRSTKKPSASSNDDFDAILRLLTDESLTYKDEEKGPIRMSIADWFYESRDSLVTGISNTYGMSSYHNFLFFELSPKLAVHGFTEDQKVAGVKWRTIKTTKKGNELLAYVQKKLAVAKQSNAMVTPTAAKPVQAGGPVPVSAVAADSSAAKPVASSPAKKATKKTNVTK